MSSQYGKGAIKGKRDRRDFEWKRIGMALPPFNWQQGYDVEIVVGKIPSKNQFQTYSCGGQAWSYYMGIIRAIANKSYYEEESAKFVYSQTFVKGGGSGGRENSDICVKQGVSHETLCPSYQSGTTTEAFMERPQDITQEAKDNAKLDQALSYARVKINIDTIAQAVQANGAVILGIYGEDNGTWLSEFPTPPHINAWAHWIICIKAKTFNGKKYLGLKNSWGPDVGNDGVQWIGEDYLNAIFDAWTLVFKPIDQTGKYVFNRNMAFGEKSEDVRQLQIKLNMLPQYQTGTYGIRTYFCVFWFQYQHGITMSGAVDDATRVILNS